MKVKPVNNNDESSSQPSAQDNEKLLNESKGKKKDRHFLLHFFLSVRLFLIVVITLLVIATALSIWIAAYKVNEEAALESVNVIMQNINDKVNQFLDGQLIPAQVVSQQLRDDYQNGYIQMDDTSHPYFYSKINQLNVSIATLCFGEGGVDALYGYTREDGKVSLVRKRDGERNLLKIATDSNGVATSKVELNVTYTVPKRDFYLESTSIFVDYPDGGFGSVNQIPSGHQTIYYTSMVFNRAFLPLKVKIGIAKVNLTFQLIAEFFKGIKVLNNGYILLSEFGNDFIIGSSLPITGIERTRVKAFNITTRGAGNVFKKMLLAGTPISSIQEGGEALIVYTYAYQLKNLKWRLTVVFDESEIKKGIITSSYVILGVTCGVTVIGIILSILIGWLVTNPFVKLQQDFKKIEVLDLANIKPRSSIFSESSSIYSSLTDTVNWLAEFRAFLPDCVLNQLENQQEASGAAEAELDVANEHGADSKKQHGRHHGGATSSQRYADTASNLSSHNGHEKESALGGSHHNESTFRKPGGGASSAMAAMLKLGLSMKTSSVLYMKIPLLSDSNIIDSDVLNTAICKVITGISTICKTVRGDLQIKAHNEFMVVFSDRNSSQTAMETSIKINTALQSLNDNLTKNGYLPLRSNIGIASGESLQGNVGNSTLRYFTLVGEVVSRARNLCSMCSLSNTTIIVDQESHDINKQGFIFRPVDRYLGEQVVTTKKHNTDQNSSSIITTVYELLKKNAVADDEWLYELEQKKENAKYDNYSQVFDKIFCNGSGKIESSEIMSVKNVLEELRNPNDKVVERLFEVIERAFSDSEMRDMPLSFVNYHSNIATSINSFMDYNVPLNFI